MLQILLSLTFVLSSLFQTNQETEVSLCGMNQSIFLTPTQNILFHNMNSVNPDISFGCEIGNLVLDATDCDDAGKFYVSISFDYANVSDSFKIVGNGQYYGNFSYADLPVTLGPFDGTSDNAYEFVVKDLANPDCKAANHIPAHHCGGNCELYNLGYNQGGCDDLGNFTMYLNCGYSNTSDSFKLYYDGIYKGTFAYTDMPVELSGLPGDGKFHVYKLIDKHNGDCRIVKEFKSPECVGNECEIGNLVLDATDCDDAGKFYVSINFDYANVSDSFKIVGNGQYYGSFSYADLPVTLGPFDGTSDKAYEFVVKDLGNSDCKAAGHIPAHHCGGNCELYNLGYNHGECDDHGNFTMYLNCEHINTSDSFKLYYDGIYKGTFAYTDMPVELSGLPGDGKFHVYKLIDKHNGDCRIVKEFKSPECVGNECEIGNLVLDATDCDDAGKFYVSINFDYANVSDSFKIVGNGQYYGSFSYADLPVTLGPFDGTSDKAYEFVVKDLGNSDCKAAGHIPAHHCGGNCELYNLGYNHGECDDHGNFTMYLNCEHINTSDSFKLYYDGIYKGTFAYADMPVKLSGLPGDGKFHVYKLIDKHNGDCRIVKEFKSPNCDAAEQCELGQPTILPSSCNDSGQFYVQIDFSYADVSDSFKIKGNGHNYGHFSYSDLPVVLGPFDGNVDVVYEFGIIDLSDNKCYTSGYISPPYCQNGFPYTISQIGISRLICIDSVSYTATIELLTDGLPDVSFKLFQENSFIGNYYVGSFPVDVTLKKSHLPRVKIADEKEYRNFAISVYQHPDCLLNVNENEGANARCYPNPLSSHINLEWQGQAFSFRIFDLSGREHLKGQCVDKTEVDMSRLDSGVYIVVLNGGRTNSMFKMIKLY